MPESLRMIDNLGYALRPDIFHTELLGVVRKNWKEHYRDAVMDPRVERAILTVPRHKFTSRFPFSEIYGKNSILVHEGHDDSTASEPGLVAYMTQLVLPEEDLVEGSIALDIGCGLGYQTAMLKAVGFSRVVGAEIKPEIARKAQRIFKDDPRVAIVEGDGRTIGDGFRFDAIVVAALVNSFDTINALSDKLKEGGKIVAPVRETALSVKFGFLKEEEVEIKPDDSSGILISAIKGDGLNDLKVHFGVTFVPFV